MLTRLGILFILLTVPLFAYEKVYLTQEDALSRVFSTIPSPNTTSINSESITYYKNDSGVAFILNEMGKYYPITLIVKITPEEKVSAAHIMVYREHVGAGVRKKRFLKQFNNKSLDDDLMVDRDINGISGATISSWSVSTAVKKALDLAHYIYEKTPSH